MNRFVIVSGLVAALVLSACNADLASTTGDVLGAAEEATATTGNGKKDAQVSAAGDVFKAATVSDSELRAYSRQMIAARDKQAPVAKAGDKYATRLARLTRKHAREDGLKLNFKVYLTKDVNAFATPDGSIRVYSGLMDLMTDDELLSILGHEIGHVKNGHSLQKMRTAYLASAGAKLASAQGKLSAQVLSELGESFVNAQFSQSMESDADTYGIAFLKRNKYKLPAAESAMRKLADLDGTAAGGSNSLFSSHPGSGQRADKIHELISE
ncbi:lipoprotein [Betaproteobacteria bacterium]|nr:lipoprotein [Betaproteobacteria bacterium]GHT98897.1 lipoprotein [Betaproteobacteria bacterium]GHU21019.1 lipoprotein [Betaproteobacteria bacterium]